ncbi:MAG: ATP synthase F0 sector subunit c, partial [uncultured Frankineae bacterium]
WKARSTSSVTASRPSARASASVSSSPPTSTASPASPRPVVCCSRSPSWASRSPRRWRCSASSSPSSS